MVDNDSGRTRQPERTHERTSEHERERERAREREGRRYKERDRERGEGSPGDRCPPSPQIDVCWLGARLGPDLPVLCSTSPVTSLKI